MCGLFSSVFPPRSLLFTYSILNRLYLCGNSKTPSRTESHWPLTRLHLLGSHQLLGQLLWLFIAFHTYLSERPVALTSLTCRKFSFHIQPLTCLGASCPVFLLRVTAVTAHSLLLSGTNPSTWVTDSLAPPDSGCHFCSCILSLLLIIKLSPSML